MNNLNDIIRHEIAPRGIIPFARFMELALYCPVYGFYEREGDTIGQRGHYYTSVSTGSLFGELLAFQFAEWIEAEGRWQKAECGNKTGRWQIVEAGAHDGRLAADILTWLRLRQPELFERIEYWIVEPSARRQQWQQQTLESFSSRARWLSRFNDSTVQRFNGVIFSNELLDALPVHRFGWDAAKRTWFEWGVAASGDRFVWARMTEPIHDSRFTIHAPPELLAVLPDGYTVEICPAAEEWWRTAANALASGKLLTIDYGLTAEESFRPARSEGTLRAYQRHRLSHDVLAQPSAQDITAHVNFSALQAAGESAGLKTDGLFTQGQFLTRIAERAWKARDCWGEWMPDQTRQFQTLIHPEHLGRAFRVLVQSR